MLGKLVWAGVNMHGEGGEAWEVEAREKGSRPGELEKEEEI